MKKFKALSLIALSALQFGCFGALAQEPVHKKIAVATPQVTGLHTDAVTAEKMIRIELSKIDLYYVYDEFDMADAIGDNPEFKTGCQSKSCLTALGKQLDVDLTISGSFDKLGNKLLIHLKLVDVKSGDVLKTAIQEFDDQELELQRMTQCLIRSMHGMEVDKMLKDRLYFREEPATLNNVGRINNSGPRIGYAVMTGDLMEFATRSTNEGGLDIFPAVSMIGYQFEIQYTGTENFSALFEFIPNISGLEQGKFIPTLTILNGFRFGKAGWEIAFGPGIGLKQTTRGFFDHQGEFGDVGEYFNEADWNQYAREELSNDPQYSPDGTFVVPDPSDVVPGYEFGIHADTRGKTEFSPNFLFAFGRTFRAGSLNIPVNLFYSAKSKGGIAGINVGFNVIKSKRSVKRIP